MRSAILSLPILVLLAACASSTGVGDRHYESRRFAEAQAAYETYLAGEARDAERIVRSLYRLGVIYSLPEGPAYDPEHAIEVLARVEKLDRGGHYATEATLLRNLQEKVVELNDRASADRDALAALQAQIEGLQTEVQTTEEATEVQDEEVQLLKGEIARLEEQGRALREELQAKEQELERLKAIDLEMPRQSPSSRFDGGR